MNYFDTSVLFAASQQSHTRHAECLRVVVGADKRNSACSLHTLAELYSTLTRVPPPYRMTPRDALLIVEHVQSHFTCVTLTTTEYMATIRAASARGLVSGAIHDAIHVQSAVKVGAGKIYTLNLRDFQRVDPSLNSRILEP